MIIALYILLRITLIAGLVFLALYCLRQTPLSDAWQTFAAGVKDALRGCGFHVRGSRYPVELYKWQPGDPEEVCSDGIERASWPAMDIVDWMEKGLPGTPEAATECGEHCSCRLVQVHPHPVRESNRQP